MFKKGDKFIHINYPPCMADGRITLYTDIHTIEYIGRDNMIYFRCIDNSYIYNTYKYRIRAYPPTPLDIILKELGYV